MSFDKMQGGGSYTPSNNYVKSRFSYNTKNTQSIEAPEYLLGSREGIEQISKFHQQGLKRDIGMRLGNSYEAPDSFKTDYGIISDKTYDNPHLKKSEQLQKYIRQGPRKSNSMFSQVQKNCILGGNVKNIQTFNITDNSREKTKLQRQKTQPVIVIDKVALNVLKTTLVILQKKMML
ncbi:hypothetical protein PPERSA_11388 [Pseudocohnilembus persalinus]|uniref:Uncharacterized protein n=1 Tax=Pseudocohnilembus persalinus TaxID=266149 RepID=A0A0V0QQG8_PSEPJ|nr:hypothetical protein PPERSA_11388 [Pseudocohnilembus persalinus]|eukprot:KRX04264.1 hypothetical protein PPERSA_11388 [Pseudocohnilembus persalinus]